MRKVFLFFILLIPYIPLPGQTFRNEIFSGWGWTSAANMERSVICLRRLTISGKQYLFTVSPYSLKTSLVPADSLFVMNCPNEFTEFLFEKTPYLRALKQAEVSDAYIQDAGITRFSSGVKGIDLTIDLCPSRLPLDREVFKDMITEIGNVERPVPVAICITGKWIRSHPGDLAWLRNLEKSGDLSITWVNHSYNHVTYRNVAVINNFMLSPGTDTDAEVLNNETAMLKMGIIPSVFFRFPGLISDRSIYDRILRLGLIPLGSDAWLAKGQKPVNGSIVLIHANGNEPVGIKDFILLLRKREKDLLSHKWELFDLRESLVEDEGNADKSGL